jgi:hypothetical protein
MDATNRVLAVGVALLWIFLIFVVILLAWGAPDQSIDRLGDLAGYLEDHNTNGAKMIITFGGLILALLGLIIILVEIAPPESGNVRIAKVGAGEALIGTDEVARQVEQEMQSVPHLRSAKVRVAGRGKKAELRLDLDVAAEADVASVATEACLRAREVVEGRIGVELEAAPRAQVRYAGGEKVTMAPAPRPSWQPASTDSAPKRAGDDDAPASSAHETSTTEHEGRPTGT